MLDISIPPSYFAYEQGGHGRDSESQQLSQTLAQAFRIHVLHSTVAPGNAAPSSLSERTSAVDLDALRSHLCAALSNSNLKRVKGVLQAMIDGIRVDVRDRIEPTCRILAVRIDYGYMEPAEVNANRSAVVAGGRMSLDQADEEI